jgi:hypothetical protein
VGREIKRVPVDFDWSINKTWQGYLMPDELDLPTCPGCKGRGDTTASQWLETLCRQIEMLGSDIEDQELGQPLHPWLAQNPYAAVDRSVEPIERRGMWVTYPVVRPSADILDLLTAVTGQDKSRFGRFGGQGYYLYRALIEKSGIEGWGRCPTCNGRGEVGTELQRAAHDAWERSEPPEGDGWQLWETVSEGSPISPVFPTADGLIDWMTTPAAEWGAMGPWSREQAAAFVNGPGWAPTGVFTPTDGLMDGVTAVSRS